MADIDSVVAALALNESVLVGEAITLIQGDGLPNRLGRVAVLY